ncbi:hypothetical protein BJ742DRAFT_742217 [Cladochytrium replicatum]|nr:hypothetical protein BJ742DRAFT_742217 [Cladochytrium replicatum]
MCNVIFALFLLCITCLPGLCAGQNLIWKLLYATRCSLLVVRQFHIQWYSCLCSGTQGSQGRGTGCNQIGIAGGRQQQELALLTRKHIQNEYKNLAEETSSKPSDNK